MNFKRYIHGSRKGKEAHRIELEAMKDPFLSDALDGYDLVKDDNHQQRIENLQRKIGNKTSRRYHLLQITGIAASLILFIASGAYLMIYKSTPYINESHIAYSEDDYQQSISEIASYESELAGPEPLRVSHKMVIPEPEPFVDIPVTGEPKPAEGMKAFKKYLYDNLFIPAFDECGRAKGKVVVAFKVNAMGRPYDLDIKKSLCSTADQEALRVIKEGPNWTMGDKEVFCTIKF